MSFHRRLLGCGGTARVHFRFVAMLEKMLRKRLSVSSFGNTGPIWKDVQLLLRGEVAAGKRNGVQV